MEMDGVLIGGKDVLVRMDSAYLDDLWLLGMCGIVGLWVYTVE